MCRARIDALQQRFIKASEDSAVGADREASASWTTKEFQIGPCSARGLDDPAVMFQEHLNGASNGRFIGKSHRQLLLTARDKSVCAACKADRTLQVRDICAILPCAGPRWSGCVPQVINARAVQNR